MFPFARFPGVDTVLGPEMKSTGEVMGLDTVVRDRLRQEPDRRRRQAAAQGHGVRLGPGRRQAAHPAGDQAVESLGFKIIATCGTQRYLAEQGIPAAKINKVLEGRPHIVDAIKNGGVQLVINTTEGAAALADSRSLRHAALLHKVPYYTTLSGAVAAAQGIKAYLGGDLEVRALQSYYGSRT